MTQEEVAEALGHDASLYVYRDPDGWHAEVEWQAQTFNGTGATLPEAVAAALSDLAAERNRDPATRLRDSLRTLLAIRDGRFEGGGEALEAAVAQARRLAGGE